MEPTEQEPTGSIRITKVPAGQAPHWVREKWVGLVLPCYPVAGHAGLTLGVESLEPQPRPIGFIVPQEEAIAILRGHDSAAAAWWNAKGFPRPMLPNFCFQFDEAEIIEGVTIQQIIEVTDEMQGDPNR